MSNEADPRPRTVHVPLHDFLIAGDPEQLSLLPDVLLTRRVEPPTLDYRMLGFDERNALTEEVVYWLSVREPRSDGVSAASLANTWIFSLWLVRPTRTAIHHRFDEFEEPNTSRSTRLITRAGYNHLDLDDRPFEAAELLRASSYLEILNSIGSSTRLGLALSLSVESTWVHRWSPGLMLTSSAVESLLTYSEKFGISSRLAKTFAAITAPVGSRDAARARFEVAYRRRSKLVHGRLPSATDNERLEDFAEWSRMLRDIWREVLDRPALLAALQGDDSAREAHFNSL